MQAITIYMTNFGCIVVTKDLIDCKSFVDYKSHMTQKFAVEVMIDFVVKEFVIYVNAAGVVVK